MDDLLHAEGLRMKSEWWSKLIDGLLTSAILILIWLTIALSIHPISIIFGPPGLLIYVLGLLAVAMYALQHALAPGRSITARAWFGITGGFLAWSVVEVSSYLGVPIMPHLAGLVLLIMVALIVGLLWRAVLPVGVRFFSLTFLLNWTEHVMMRIQETLAGFSPIFKLTYRATGYLALIVAVLALAWILFQSRRRIDRISAALAVWFLVSLAIYVFRGSLF